MTLLYEKHKPATLEEVVGQEKAVATIKRLLSKGWGGRAWWISGASGTGKSTLARIIAGHGADELFTMEYDTPDTIKQADMEHLQQDMHYCAGGKGGRAYIINEAHGLWKMQIRQFLGILERIPKHVCFVFTTTAEGQKALFGQQIDAHPLLSRCTVLELEYLNLFQVFAEHCKKIAVAEKLDGQGLGEYVRLAQRCKSNCREMLMKIEAGEML